MWRGCCIIRSAFLGNFRDAFDKDPKLINLLLDPLYRAYENDTNGINQIRYRWITFDHA